MNDKALLFRSIRIVLFTAGCVAPAVAVAAPPVAGPNVNMVSGTKFPEGDPSLTKQNEESHAISSRNPRHLMGGANDYRQVPILAAEGQKGGKAWIQIYKSVDGGESWRSTPLGGCPVNTPQCTDPTGLTAAVKALKPDFSADPTMRPGPFGTFFLSFIAGKRDTAADGMIAVQRFVDKNNDIQRTTDFRSCTTAGPGCSELSRSPPNCTGGPPGCVVSYVRYKPAEDPFLPDVVNILDRGTPGQFNDKPWNAADVPGRSWNAGKSCNLLAWTNNRTDVSPSVENVPAFNVYVSFAKFVGQSANEHPQMHVSVSNDCGNTFSKPTKLTPGNLGQNSGSNIAIDPLTGAVYVVWRNFDGDSQIFLSKSTDGGKTWSKKPIEIAKFNAYDQGTTGASFRTLAFPTIAVSVDYTLPTPKSRVHVAWSQRKAMPAATPPYACQATDPADCDARVVMSTSLDGGNTWPTPTPVDSNFTVEYETKVNGVYVVPARSHQRGHQVQPAMAFAGGKLLITWLDQRLDHTEGVLRCPAGNTCTNVGELVEFREGVGNLDGDCTNSALPSPYGPACYKPEVVFTTYMSDGEPGLVRRHTLDTYAAMASPAEIPVFESTRVSQYTFGSTVAGIVQSNGDLLPDTPATIPIRQKEVNAVNLPMFADGRAAFIGDYIEAAGQHILGSKFNVGGGANGTFTTSGPAPLFHVSFTDNRDVIPPIDGNWATPTCLATKLTTDNTGIVNGSTNFSGCLTDGFAGNRNANVYTAVVAENSQAFAHSNSKLLSFIPTPPGASPPPPRGFTVTVQNLSDKPRTYTLCLTGSTCNVAQASGVTARFNKESFPPGTAPAITTLAVAVQPRSSSTRSVWASVNNANLTKSKVLVGVTSSDANGTFSSQVVLNPDPNGTFVTNGDGTSTDAANQDLGNVVLSNAVLTNNALSNNALTNNVLTNAALTNAVLSNVMLSNAVLTNFQLENLSTANDPLGNNALTNAALSNVVLTNAVLSNNALSNVVLSNAVLSNTALNAALTNLDPGNVALSNAVLSNNALTNVVLSNSGLGNAMLSNAVLSNAALTNAVLSNAALTNNVQANNALSNNVLSNVVLSNAPLVDIAGGEQKAASEKLRAIEPASFELTSSPFTTSNLETSNFRETSFTVRNRGNTDATLSIKVMLRDAICQSDHTCTTPAGYKLMLILRKVAFTPSAIAPTTRASGTGNALRIGLTQRNSIVSNIGTLPLIDPDDPNLGKFLPDDPSAATLALGAGEFAYATIRAIGDPGFGPPPDPADLLRWGVQAISANSTNADGPLFIVTQSLPSVVASGWPPSPNTPVSATFRAFGGKAPITASAIACTDENGNSVLQGTGAPSAATGDVGTSYIDNFDPAARVVYGPKIVADLEHPDPWNYGPTVNSPNFPVSPNPQIGTALPGDQQAGPKARLACPLSPINFANFVTDTNPDSLNYQKTSADLAFTAPQFWGTFYMLASAFDSTSASTPKDKQVIRTVVAPRPPVLTFSPPPLGTPPFIYKNSGIDLRDYASSDSVNSAGDRQEILFSATGGACSVDNTDHHTLNIDYATDAPVPPTNYAAKCMVTVSQNGNETYAQKTLSPIEVKIDRASQSITVDPPPTPLTFDNFGAAAGTITAHATSPTAPDSGLTVTFVSQSATCNTTGPTGSGIQIVHAGPCNVVANQVSGSGNYKPVLNVVVPTITINKAAQLIVNFVTPADHVKRFGDLDFNVTASVATGPSGSPTASNSGLAVTFSVPPTPPTTACSVTPTGTVTILHSGTCRIKADQGGNGDYDVAPSVTKTFEIDKAEFHINATVSPTSFVYGDDLPPSLVSLTYGYTPSANPTTAPCFLGVTGDVTFSGQPSAVPAPAAIYTIVPAVASNKVSPDCDVIYANASLTVSRAPAEFDVDSSYFTPFGPPASPTSIAGNLNRPDRTIVYPTAPDTFSVKVKKGATIVQSYTPTPGAPDGAFTVTDGLLAPESYTVEFSYPGSTNFEPATPVTSILHVEGYSATADMATARTDHTATLLNDGSVLVVGGVGGTAAPMNSAELYCPDTMSPAPTTGQPCFGNLGTFVARPSATNARAGHTATLLQSGKVLVAGGTTAADELFDPLTSTWSSVTANVAKNRFHHTATLLGDGTVFVAGGSNATGTTLDTTAIYTYSVAGGTVASGPTLGDFRERHTATLLADGKVLIAGGRKDNGGPYTPLPSAEIYDPVTSTIAAATAMGSARFSHTATLLAADQRVLVAGGSSDTADPVTSSLQSFEIYTPNATTGTWSSPLGALGDARREFSATRLLDGFVIAAGGVNGTTSRVPSSELFDPAPAGPDTFAFGPPLVKARSGHTAILLPDGRVFVVGGLDNTGQPTKSAEFYNGMP